jgi:hypothetical protein
MNNIVYIEGGIADALGTVRLQQLVENIAKEARLPVSLLTHGVSDHHGERRFFSDKGYPAPSSPARRTAAAIGE